jgi:hypothetical protein
MSTSPDGPYRDARSDGWRYRLDGKSVQTEFKTKEACAIAYVHALVNKHPKYKPLFEGKTWPEIFKTLRIVIQ